MLSAQDLLTNILIIGIVTLKDSFRISGKHETFLVIHKKNHLTIKQSMM